MDESHANKKKERWARESFLADHGKLFSLGDSGGARDSGPPISARDASAESLPASLILFARTADKYFVV